MLADIITIIIVSGIIAGAVIYIVKSRKKGVSCIGCPHSGKCNGKCGK